MPTKSLMFTFDFVLFVVTSILDVYKRQVQLSMFFVLLSCDSLFILSNHCSFVKNFFIFLNFVLSSLSCDSLFILSKCFSFVKNFFHFLLHLCFKAKESAGGGIRTHAPLRTNGFQDRLVMTTSIPPVSYTHLSPRYLSMVESTVL